MRYIFTILFIVLGMIFVRLLVAAIVKTGVSHITLLLDHSNERMNAGLSRVICFHCLFTHQN